MRCHKPLQQSVLVEWTFRLHLDPQVLLLYRGLPQNPDFYRCKAAEQEFPMSITDIHM